MKKIFLILCMVTVSVIISMKGYSCGCIDYQHARDKAATEYEKNLKALAVAKHNVQDAHGKSAAEKTNSNALLAQVERNVYRTNWIKNYWQSQVDHCRLEDRHNHKSANEGLEVVGGLLDATVIYAPAGAAVGVLGAEGTHRNCGDGGDYGPYATPEYILDQVNNIYGDSLSPDQLEKVIADFKAVDKVGALFAKRNEFQLIGHYYDVMRYIMQMNYFFDQGSYMQTKKSQAIKRIKECVSSINKINNFFSWEGNKQYNNMMNSYIAQLSALDGNTSGLYGNTQRVKFQDLVRLVAQLCIAGIYNVPLNQVHNKLQGSASSNHIDYDRMYFQAYPFEDIPSQYLSQLADPALQFEIIMSLLLTDFDTLNNNIASSKHYFQKKCKLVAKNAKKLVDLMNEIKAFFTWKDDVAINNEMQKAITNIAKASTQLEFEKELTNIAYIGLAAAMNIGLLQDMSPFYARVRAEEMVKEYLMPYLFEQPTNIDKEIYNFKVQKIEFALQFNNNNNHNLKKIDINTPSVVAKNMKGFMQNNKEYFSSKNRDRKASILIDRLNNVIDEEDFKDLLHRLARLAAAAICNIPDNSFVLE